MNDLEKAAHPKSVFLIKKNTRAIIYPEGPQNNQTWILSIGNVHKTDDWRKTLGKFDNVEQAVAAAKALGFGSVSVRHAWRVRSWGCINLLHERSWRNVYSDRRANGPIRVSRVRYGLTR